MTDQTPFAQLLQALWPLGLPESTELTIGQVPVTRHNPDGTLTPVHSANWEHHATIDSQPDSIVARIAAEQPGRTIYFGPAATVAGLGKGQKGRRTDIAAIPALWLDLDYRTATKTSGATVEQIDTLIAELERLEIPVGVTVNTGGGVHAYILLDEPAEGDDIDIALELGRRLHVTAQRILGDNVTLDAVGNADRVLRPPGSVRHKKDDIGQHVATLGICTPDRRVGLDHLDQTLDNAPPIRIAKPVDPDRQLTGLDLVRAAYDAETSCHDVLAAAGWARHGTDGWTHPGGTVPPSARVITADTTTGDWPAGVRDMAVVYSGQILARLGYNAPLRLRASVLATELLHNGDSTAFILQAEQTGHDQWLATFGIDGDTARRETVNRAALLDPPGIDDDPTLHPASVIVWGNPEPILPGDSRPPFPTHVLPPVAQAALDRAVTAIGCQPDLVAAVIIGTYSTLGTWSGMKVAAGGATDRVNLWQLIVAPPSAGKTPVFNLFALGPLTPIEETRRQQRITDDRITSGAHKTAVAALENEERAAGKANRPIDPTFYTAIPPEPPRTSERALISSGTAEAVESYCANSGGALSIMSPEGGLLSDLSAYSDNKGGAGAKVTPLLGLHSGDKQVVARVDTTKRRELPNDARLAQCLAVQPVVAEPLFSNPAFRRTGYLARTMLVWIGDKSISRTSRQRVTPADMAAYNRHVNQLADTVASNPDGWTITLTPAAETAHWDADDLTRTHIEQHTAHDHHSLVWESLSKLADSVLRLAACLHVAHGRPVRDPVDIDAIVDAWHVGACWLEHLLFAERHVTLTARRGGDEKARLLLSAAVALAALDTDDISPRDIVRATACEPDEAVAMLEQLRQAGWVATSDDMPVASRTRGWRKGSGQTILRHPSLADGPAVLSAAPSESLLVAAIEGLRTPVVARPARYTFKL